MSKIFVPATCANLGPGFDTLGICLSLYNTFEYTRENEFRLSGFPEQFDLDNNLVLESYKAVFDHLQKEVIPLHIHAECMIPVSRGLGSSSTCIVAGCTLANELLGNPLTLHELATIATRIEGHPDNVVPCIYGGCVASKVVDDRVHHLSYPLSKAIRFLLLIPNFEVKTSHARSVLKKSIPLTDAISNIQNTLFLLEGLKTANATLIHIGIEDALHVPYRKELISEYSVIEDVVTSNGSCGFTISGAGPTCLALFTSPIPLEQIKKELSHCSHTWEAVELQLNMKGTYTKDTYGKISDR